MAPTVRRHIGWSAASPERKHSPYRRVQVDTNDDPALKREKFQQMDLVELQLPLVDNL
jgi:hypothetical protein